MVRVILVDSNIWIFAEVKGGDEHYLAVEKLRHQLGRGVVTNVIVCSDVFHLLSRMFGSAVARARLDTILNHPAVEWHEFTRTQMLEAVRLSHAKLLRINDALIAQQASELNVPILTDNVKDFRKVKGIEIIPLR